MAERLAQLRSVLNGNQAAVARLIGISQPAWNRYERGTRDIDVAALTRFCEIFGVSADWVVLGDLYSLPGEVIARLVEAYPQIVAETAARRLPSRRMASDGREGR